MAIASVRPAAREDIADVVRIQLETWQVAYADLLPPDVLAGLDAEQAALTWTEALATAQVFVATEGEWTVGFCAAGPAPEPELADAEGALPEDAATVGLISTLLVEPRWGRRGHGGRLLATAAQALRAGGSTRAITWVPERDEASRKFYGRAGWGADGTARTLDAGGRPLREIRLSGTVELTLVD